MPNLYCDWWLQLALPSAETSRAELTHNSKLIRYTAQRGPHRKHRFKQFLHRCVRTMLIDGSGTAVCLHSHCLAMAVALAPLF
jgi:hypothetical protein